METQEKFNMLKALVSDLLDDSKESMVNKIDHVLNSGAIDIDGWDEKNAPMILPKCIVMSLSEHQITQYDARGTGFEKQVKKEVRNIRYFI